jgi:hypothetical protein
MQIIVGIASYCLVSTLFHCTHLSCEVATAVVAETTVATSDCFMVRVKLTSVKVIPFLRQQLLNKLDPFDACTLKWNWNCGLEVRGW